MFPYHDRRDSVIEILALLSLLVLALIGGCSYSVWGAQLMDDIDDIYDGMRPLQRHIPVSVGLELGYIDEVSGEEWLYCWYADGQRERCRVLVPVGTLERMRQNN